MSTDRTMVNQTWHDTLTPVVSLTMVLAIAGLVAFAGSMLRFQPPTAQGAAMVSGHVGRHPLNKRDKEIKVRFQEAVAMLHAKRYRFALPPLQRLLELDPKMPEAYVNTGFALLGLKRYKRAEVFFQKAIDLKPYQDNAYWGLAVSLENQNDLRGALGAMRTYIHLAQPNDPYVRRARSAIWEWQYHLKRGPLPDSEKAWLKRGGQQWDDRNSPKRDMPPQGPKAIPISVSPID